MKHIKGLRWIAITLALLLFTFACENPASSIDESDGTIPTGIVRIIEKTESPYALIYGLTKQLSAEVLPADADNKTVTWKSSHPAIASVDQTGLVTGTGIGTAYITAEAGGVLSSVFWVDVDVLGIVLTPKTQSLYTADTYPMNAKITPRGLAGSSWEWTSSDDNVAAVSNTGMVTALSAGTATITVASTVDPEVKDSCVITVSVRPNFETIFFWDAAADAGLADIGAENIGESFHVTNPSIIGGNRTFAYNGTDYIFQNYVWTGNTNPTGFAPGAPGPMKKVDAGQVINGITVEKGGYFLNEALSPCLQIGSTARGRTTASAMPTGYNVAPNGQFDFRDGRFRITVNYTPVAAGSNANFIVGVIYNGGSAPGTATPFAAASNYVNYNDTTVNAGAERTYIHEFNTTNASTSQRNALQYGFITVRAAVQSHDVVVHSIKIEKVLP